MPPPIPNPKHILLLTSPPASPTPILTTLQTNPSEPAIHTISTPYYTAHIPIWQDTLTSTWIQEWTTSPDTADVLRAIAAWIFVFELPTSQLQVERVKDALLGVRRMIRDVLARRGSGSGGEGYPDGEGEGEGGGYPDFEDEGVWLAVGLSPSGGARGLLREEDVKVDVKVDVDGDVDREDWDGICFEAGGWEFIDASASAAAGSTAAGFTTAGVHGSGDVMGRNEFGEVRGLPRLLEALQVAEWQGEDEIEGVLEGVDGLEFEEEELDGDGGDSDVELQRELQGFVGSGMEAELRQPIMLQSRSERKDDDGLEGDEDHVDELQTMLLKLQAARDLGADLPQFERRKLAAQAVKEVMRM